MSGKPGRPADMVTAPERVALRAEVDRICRDEPGLPALTQA
jgi:hypothetical protein